MRYRYMIGVAALLFGLATHTINAHAQAAGAGADFNKANRQTSYYQSQANYYQSERQRVECYDRPAYKDPLGNALIGGAVTGVMKGAAEGAFSALKGAATGEAMAVYNSSSGYCIPNR